MNTSAVLYHYWQIRKGTFVNHLLVFFLLPQQQVNPELKRPSVSPRKALRTIHSDLRETPLKAVPNKVPERAGFSLNTHFPLLLQQEIFRWAR